MTTLPTLRQLRHLVALADHGHFGRAAEAVAVTQSTLSASIKELETVLQAALVDRTRRQVVLTPLGRQTVERARRILADTEALALAARSQRDPLSGTIRMGVIPTIAPYLLPAVLPGLRRAYRELQLYLVEDLTPRLLEQLHTGSLDVVLLALPYDCGNVDSATLFDDRFLLALPPDHPLAKERRVDPERLRSEEVLLLRDGHCLREHALSVCDLADRRRTEAFEATSLPTLVQMVDNGLGVTPLPELAVDAGLLRGTSLVTRPLASEEPGREIALVWRRGTGRREEFLLLAKELAARAKKVRNEPARRRS
jgi:LysR family transcriptional regulator, hydrogen peroxide-inducible genes activator